MGKKQNFIWIMTFLLVSVFTQRSSVLAADTTITSLNLSGTVPTYFSVTPRGMAGDLDLTPNVTVNNRRIGLLHFKYNANVASITVGSSTPSGGPEGPSGTYNFQGGFKVSIGAGCFSVDPAFTTPFVLTAGGTDVKSAGSTALVAGVEEDCDVLASWRGSNVAIPLAGVYSLNINVTMVSQ